MSQDNKSFEVSVILPCQNEEQAIERCLEDIKRVFEQHNIHGEIIVSDSSQDQSPQIAKKHQVKLVKHDMEGYGRAYLEGFKHANGNIIFMADADGSYDFNEIPRFIEKIKQGADFVIGNRFKGGIEKNAMPWHHQYLGNPILSFILRLFFKGELHDAHCGMRAIRREALNQLNFRTTGMEFASEMIVKVIQQNLKCCELPIRYHKRQGVSKLKSFADGWRHLRFMLLYSPLFLFLIPGVILFLVGLSSMVWLYFGDPSFFGIRLFYHPIFFSSVLMIVGYQMIIFSVFAKTYSVTHLKEKSVQFQKLYQYITIEKASLIGIFIVCLGVAIYGYIFLKWISSDFGPLQEVQSSVVALTLVTLGAQTIISSFMLSILGIKER